MSIGEITQTKWWQGCSTKSTPDLVKNHPKWTVQYVCIHFCFTMAGEVLGFLAMVANVVLCEQGDAGNILHLYFIELLFTFKSL